MPKNTKPEIVSDDQIDLSDIPEIKDFTGAVVGKFYRPKTESVEDQEVIDYHQCSSE